MVKCAGRSKQKSGLVKGGEKMRVAHLLIQHSLLFVRYQTQVRARTSEIKDTDQALLEVHLGALMGEVRTLRGD